MKLLILLLSVVSSVVQAQEWPTLDNTTLYFGLGKVIWSENPWRGQAPAVVIELEWHASKSISVKWTHTSNLLDGPPFNSFEEDYTDVLHIGYRCSLSGCFN